MVPSVSAYHGRYLVISILSTLDNVARVKKRMYVVLTILRIVVQNPAESKQYDHDIGQTNEITENMWSTSSLEAPTSPGLC